MEVVRSVARVDAIQLHRSEARCVRYSSRGEFIRRKMIEDNEPQGGHRNFLYWIWSTFVVWHEYMQFNCTVPKLVRALFVLGGILQIHLKMELEKKPREKISAPCGRFFSSVFFFNSILRWIWRIPPKTNSARNELRNGAVELHILVPHYEGTSYPI